jgi:hypothetical protein
VGAATAAVVVVADTDDNVRVVVFSLALQDNSRGVLDSFGGDIDLYVMLGQWRSRERPICIDQRSNVIQRLHNRLVQHSPHLRIRQNIPPVRVNADSELRPTSLCGSVLVFFVMRFVRPHFQVV